MDWKTCRKDFEWDGSWRDVYVFQTTVEDWRVLFDLLRRECPLETSEDATAQSLPSANADLRALRQQFLPRWLFRVGGILFVCHCFSLDEMEFDFDPREIRSQTDWDALLCFIRRLGDALGKPVVLTPENGPMIPILTYDPTASAFQHHRISR